MKASRTRVIQATLGVTAAVGLAGAGLATGESADKSADLKAAIDLNKPKSVILLIGDGMGDSEVTSGRYYGKGADGRLAMDRMPFRGDVVTYGLSPAPSAPYPPNYVPDSAPTATAWSTGRKTIDGRVSQGPSSATNVPGSNDGYKTTIEVARERGMSTGNVATSEITDATPAAPSSHISQRRCQGPADTRTSCPEENKGSGGLGSIAEQQVDHEIDVILGGGRSRYAQNTDGSTTRTVLSYAQQNKRYRYVESAQQLAEVDSLQSGQRLLGLFAGGNMTTEFAPLVATETGAGSPTTRCNEQRPANEPSLEAMTRKAIQLLQNNPKGFFLQVEGASIDKRDHAADACGQIGELLAFDRAVAAALEYQRAHPDTLVVTTADHSHTSQIIPVGQKARGLTATLQTADGAPMKLEYSTGQTAGSQSHTGATVPVFAVGPRAADVTGTIDQTDLFGPLTNLRSPMANGAPPPQEPGGGSGGASPGGSSTSTATASANNTIVVNNNNANGGSDASSTTAQSGAVAAPGLRLGSLRRAYRAATLTGRGLRVKFSAKNTRSVLLALQNGKRTIASRKVAAGAGRRGVLLRVRRGTVKRGASVVLRLTASNNGRTTVTTRRIAVR